MARPRGLNQRVRAQGVILAGSGVRMPPESSLGALTAPGRTGKPHQDANGAQSAVWASLSEKQFQAIVVAGLRQRGWLVFVVPDMRKTLAGLPDLLCLHAGRDVLLALELKTVKGKATPIQLAVLELMSRVPGVDARIVRPSDWSAILEELDRV